MTGKDLLEIIFKHIVKITWPVRKSLSRFLMRTFLSTAEKHTEITTAYFSYLRWWTKSKIDIQMFPLDWLDQSNIHEKGLLRHGSKDVAFGPHNIGQDQLTETVRLPDIYYFVFENVRVSIESSSFILNDKSILVDRAVGPDLHKYNLASGHLIKHFGEVGIVRLGQTEHLKKGLFLGGNGASNYYHWLIEILAKLEFLQKLPDYYKNYPLLVSEDVSRISSFRESLDIYANGRELILLNKEASYVIENLIYINTPNNLPFNLFGDGKFKISYAAIDRVSIDFLRERALQAVEGVSAQIEDPKKIFFGRKNERRKYNQEEILDYLSNLGFTLVFMEELSFAEQVRTIHNANYIVGPTGAAWTNLIFCRPGTKALCWMAEELGAFSAYSNIANVVGVDLRYLTYKAGVNSTGELYYQDYYIDIDMIRKGLFTLGENQDLINGHA